MKWFTIGLVAVLVLALSYDSGVPTSAQEGRAESEPNENVTGSIIPLEIDDSTPGKHVLLVTVDNGGTITVERLPVYRLGATPNPPVDPGTPTGSLREQVATKARSQNDKKTSAKLSLVYDLIASRAEDFESVDQMLKATRDMRDLVWGRAEKDWEPFISWLQETLSAKSGEETFTTNLLSKYWKEISQGLADAANAPSTGNASQALLDAGIEDGTGSARFDALGQTSAGFDWTAILELLLPILLKFLTQLIGGI